jgi:3-hydroxy-3-methylglutaryl CoA synthase
MVGITSYGGYVPRLRMSREAMVAANAWMNPGLRAHAKGERSMCNWDEDALTMAVEAARDCLKGRERGDLRALYLASTTLPFEDRQCAGVVATALNLGPAIATLDVTNSQRAATSALLAALGGLEEGAPGEVLVAAADKRRTKSAAPQELLFGDGAAALTVGGGEVLARFLGAHSVAVDFVDHYRGEQHEFDYTWEQRWIRDEGYLKIVPQAVEGLFAESGLSGADIDHLVLPCVLPRVPGRLAKDLGIKAEALGDTLHGALGETGAAHPLVMLAHALESAAPGEKILVIGFGQGCDALLFETTERLGELGPRDGIAGALKRRKEETNYNKFLAFNRLVIQEHGIRAESNPPTALSTLYRKKEMILGLMGGACRECGTVQFPKTEICVNPNCNALHSQDDEPFADRAARIMSWSADWLTYAADPPAHYGMVQFEEGGRFVADITDHDPGNVEVGMAVRMVFRLKHFDQQRGFKRYFWKAAPIAALGAAADEEN